MAEMSVRMFDGEKLTKLSIENAVCKRHCTVCEGEDHHWLPECDDDGEPIMLCKHCSTWREYTDDDGEF